MNPNTRPFNVPRLPPTTTKQTTMVRVRNEGATLEGVVQTTTSNSSENIVVNVSIPVSFADGHEIRITLIPRANHPVEVHTERIRVCADAALDNEVPVAPAVTPVNNLRHHISRMNLDNNNHTPTKRNNTVAFDASPARNSSPATRPHTPVVRGSGSQAARWANAVDVSDESGDEEHELIALYPPPYGQQEIIHRDQNDGRKYYVITKGRKIGVFYSSWNAIAPICMRNQGGEYSNQPNYAAARNAWKATPRADRQIIGY